MKLSFNTSLLFDPTSAKKFRLWSFSENFLNFGQKSYKVQQITNKMIFLEKSALTSISLLKLISKVILWSSIFPITFVCLVVKLNNRRKHEFKLINNNTSLNSDNKKIRTNISQSETNSTKDSIKHPVKIKNPSSKPIATYDLKAVIERVKEAKRQGFKVGVFMGRENSQTLPAAKNWKWFSLNCDLAKDFDASHHLQMDFNSPINMGRIRGLFNKVISDWSTAKFYDDIWPTLHSLLVKEEKSELIVETGPLFIMLDYKITEPHFYPSKCYYTKPLMDSRIYTKELLERTSKILNHLFFENVEQCIGTFPGRDEDESVQSFWKISSPKIVPKNWLEIARQQNLESPPLR